MWHLVAGILGFFAALGDTNVAGPVEPQIFWNGFASEDLASIVSVARHESRRGLSRLPVTEVVIHDNKNVRVSGFPDHAADIWGQKDGLLRFSGAWENDHVLQLGELVLHVLRDNHKIGEFISDDIRNISGVNRDVLRWGSADVGDLQIRKEQDTRLVLSVVSEPVKHFQRQPWSCGHFRKFVLTDHGGGSIAGVFDRFTGQTNLLPNQSGAEKRYHHRSQSSDSHPEAPDSHALLRYEITLVAIFTAIGAWICYRAFYWFGNARYFPQALGSALIGAAGALAFAYGFILLVVGAV